MPPLSFPGASPNRIPGLERGWWRELVSRVVAAAGRVESFSPFFDALLRALRAGRRVARLSRSGGGVAGGARARLPRTAVISNFDSRLMNILRALELDHYFDFVTYSSASGAAKRKVRSSPSPCPGWAYSRRRPCTRAMIPAPTWKAHKPPVSSACSWTAPERRLTPGAASSRHCSSSRLGSERTEQSDRRWMLRSESKRS